MSTAFAATSVTRYSTMGANRPETAFRMVAAARRARYAAEQRARRERQAAAHAATLRQEWAGAYKVGVRLEDGYGRFWMHYEGPDAVADAAGAAARWVAGGGWIDDVYTTTA